MKDGFLVYVAEPIDQAKGRMPAKWPVPVDWTLYHPSRAFSGAKGSAGPEDVNRAVLATVDGVIAFLPRGVPTIGVPAEIEWAIGNGIPVAIVTDIDESVAVRGFERRGAFATHRATAAVQWLQLAMPDLAPRDQVSFVRQHPRAQLPMRGYTDDVGLDLYASTDVIIPVMQFRDVPCGVICNLPPGMWGYITNRSSTMRKHRLWVTPGVIDPSFRGELFVGIWNVAGATHHVKVGDRLGQLILMPAVCPQPVWSDTVIEGEGGRGDAGFGSTG
jgi:dUTP pyrophosphatase